MRIVDEPNIQALGSELVNLIDDAEENKLLLNFSNVKFMASAMIGKIILLHKKCKQLKIDMRLCDVADDISEVFRLMKLDKILDIQPDEKTALESFQQYKKRWYV